MSVPKSKRQESKFQCIEELRKLRKSITNLLFKNLGFDEQKYLERANEIKQNNPTKSEAMITRYKGFVEWYIEDEKKLILDYLRDAEKELVIGNNIYISTLADYDQRRYHLTESYTILKSLEIELQEVIACLPVNVNKFTYYGSMIDKICNMISNIKKYDNKKRRDIINRKYNKKKDSDKSEESNQQDGSSSFELPCNDGKTINKYGKD